MRFHKTNKISSRGQIKSAASKLVAALLFPFLISAPAFAQPTILTQPQGQTVPVGVTVNFTVQVAPPPSPPLPNVSSGSLQLWLAADTGVTPDGTGHVSDWPDQSGNGNDAMQNNGEALEPLLVNPPAINGRAALSFNGSQIATNGTYLEGTGTVNLPDDMTAFTVYMLSNSATAQSLLWVVGVPGPYGECRGAEVFTNQLDFTLWAYDYLGIHIPTNSFRIRIDQMSPQTTNNSQTIQTTDITPLGATNSVFTTTAAITPEAGYNVGGYNPSQTAGRNFGGDIAEIIIYQGQLTTNDSMAVEEYLLQKYFQSDTLSYQWQEDSTNIPGATNASLTLTNVSVTNSGSYTVIVTDPNGPTTSSPAVLSVLIPPSISAPPASATSVEGSNVTFSVSASGSGPLSFQWLYDNQPLTGATNISLTVSNVQTTNIGFYSVVVSNGIGSVTSSSAILEILISPTITVQPTSQNVDFGSNVVLSVSANTVAGALSTISPPSVTSGTLQMWLRADAGVVANGSGNVSQWMDQSPKTNNVSQTNTSLQPVLVYPAALGGWPAIQFNGIQQATNGTYLWGTNLLTLPNALTAFTVYMVSNVANAQSAMWVAGVPNIFGEARGAEIFTNQLDFTIWGNDYLGFHVPTNSFRLRIDQMNSNANSIQMSDVTPTTSSNLVISVSGASTPQAGFDVGGYNPAQTAGRNFGGDVAEIIIFQGTLSTNDLAGVTNYLLQKYFSGGVPSTAAFQWTFNGTNIAGATNSTLLLTNAQFSNAGSYSVVVSNQAGVATSSNAVLVVNSIQPPSKAVGLYGSATFSVVESNAPPLSYQWQFNAAKITNATNSSFTVSSVQATNGGSYTVVISNIYGSFTSAPAVLTVLTSSVQVVSSAANGGAAVSVPIQLLSAGNENSIDFSIDYSNAVLSYTGTTLGSNAAGAFLVVNTNQTSSGRLGVELELPGSSTFSMGTQQLAVVSFNVAPVTNAVVTTVTFGAQPTPEITYNPQSTSLPATYSNGSVFIAATAYEGDVSPRTNGDGFVELNDWSQEGLFVAGLSVPSSSNELQRADCAPRGTFGDGLITVADWVQVGRYAAGYDPVTFVSARTGPIGTISNIPSASRIMSLTSLTQGQLTNTINLQLAAQGTENAFSCSVAFDPTSLAFLSASNGAGAGALLEVNTNQIIAGNLGLALALLPGSAFAPGTQSVVQVSFVSIGYSNITSLSLGDVPVPRQVADINAAVLPVSFQNESLAVAGSSWPLLSVGRNITNVILSWPASATGFSVQGTLSLNQNWSNLPALFTTNNGEISTALPLSTNQMFYRLVRP